MDCCAVLCLAVIVDATVNQNCTRLSDPIQVHNVTYVLDVMSEQKKGTRQIIIPHLVYDIHKQFLFIVIRYLCSGIRSSEVSRCESFYHHVPGRLSMTDFLGTFSYVFDDREEGLITGRTHYLSHDHCPRLGKEIYHWLDPILPGLC